MKIVVDPKAGFQELADKALEASGHQVCHQQPVVLLSYLIDPKAWLGTLTRYRAVVSRRVPPSGLSPVSEPGYVV